MRNKKKRDDVEYIGLLKSIFDFLLITGSDVETIREIVDRAFTETINKNRQNHQGGDFGIAVAGRVLDAWHRNRRYLNDDAEPRAIPLLGRAPSVEALVKAENSRCDTAAFARRLRSLGLLVRSGRGCYRPAMRVALVGGLNPLIQQYVARSSATLLRTIYQNISMPSRSSRLIERFAEVPDLPTRYAAEFRKFSREQGWAMLNTLNDWLEARRSRRAAHKRERTVRAGLHLYAYVDATRVGIRRNIA
jgi:hypothetical protein